MATKREISDTEDSEGPQPVSKRQRKQNFGTDPTWGQQYVFSQSTNATTIPAGEEDEYEDDGDAMAYLTSVRQEASGIPCVLVAPKVQIGPQLPSDQQPENESDDDDDEPADRSIYTNGMVDARGWYSDGAYVAKPSYWLMQGEEFEGQDGSEEGEGDRETALHEAYFSTLTDQYCHLRYIISSERPTSAKSRLPPSHPTSANFRGGNTSSIAIWSRLLRNTDPHPLQLARMSKETIMTIIRILLGGKFLRQGHSLPERTSRWIWGLLARLPERGELNYMEIGWVRDLGRRAVLMGRSLAEMALLREELEEGGLGVHEGVDGSSDNEDIMGEAEGEDVEEPNGPDGPQDEAEAEAEVVETETAPPKPPSPKEEREEGEASEDEDVAMDIDSGSEADEGEVTEDPPTSLEAARARLLAQLEEQPQTEEDIAIERARMNMRATLNMILTVAGDFYGQTDLLEFREPFVGM